MPYIPNKKNKLIGSSVQYIDDSLQYGNKKFIEEADKILKTFMSRDQDHEQFQFSGIYVS